MMNVTVIIATYNRIEALRRCLNAIQKQTLSPMETIVVDDGSSDGTAHMVEAEFVTVKFLFLDSNRGPAAARNRGIAMARGEIIAFTDDDCVPPPNWLETLVKGFQDNPGIVGVGGFQEAADELISRNAVARADQAMRLQSSGMGADGPLQGGGDLPGLATNNVAYLREALLAVKGFDESFPVAAGEDTDLKVRISQLARQWATVPTAGPLLYLPLKVRHDRRYTVQAQWHMAFKRGIGAYYFERKHHRAPGFGRILLRFGVRSLRFLRDIWREPLPVALIIYLTRLGDCFGQLKMALDERGISTTPGFSADR